MPSQGNWLMILIKINERFFSKVVLFDLDLRVILSVHHHDHQPHHPNHLDYCVHHDNGPQNNSDGFDLFKSNRGTA